MPKPLSPMPSGPRLPVGRSVTMLGASSRRNNEDVALLWVTRLAGEPDNLPLDETRLPAQEQLELARWLASEPGNADAYASARQLWHSTGPSALGLAGEQAAELQAILQHPRPPLTRMRQRLAWALIASLLLAGLITLGTRPEHWFDDWRADYHSAPGQLQAVTLADGSEVLLDGDSAISVSLSEHSRDIQLRRGAAFFQVKPIGVPFVVHAPGAEINVLGTRFDVRREPQGAQVTVEEGQVWVKPQGDPDAQKITATQRLSYRHGHAGPLQTVSAPQAFEWREGRLSFRQEPLADALAVVQRYYPGRILLLNSSLGLRPVSGDFASNDPVAMLAAFQDVLGYTQHRLPGGTLVIR